MAFGITNVGVKGKETLLDDCHSDPSFQCHLTSVLSPPPLFVPGGPPRSRHRHPALPGALREHPHDHLAGHRLRLQGTADGTGPRTRSLAQGSPDTRTFCRADYRHRLRSIIHEKDKRDKSLIIRKSRRLIWPIRLPVRRSCRGNSGWGVCLRPLTPVCSLHPLIALEYC